MTQDPSWFSVTARDGKIRMIIVSVRDTVLRIFESKFGVGKNSSGQEFLDWLQSYKMDPCLPCLPVSSDVQASKVKGFTCKCITSTRE